MNVESNIAKWTILINKTNIQNSNKFTIDTINIEGENNVQEGKLAPGTKGYFDIEIDTNDTSTSIIYNVTFDFTKLSDSFSITKIEETTSGNLIKTSPDTYTKVITLEEIQNHQTNNIRVELTWENKEENNQKDSIIGLTKDSTITIPVTVTIMQYQNDNIVPYIEE